MRKRRVAMASPTSPLVLRASAGEAGLLGVTMAVMAALAVFAFLNGLRFPATLFCGVAIVAGCAALHLHRWQVVLDEQGVTVSGFMAQPLLPWTEVGAVEIEEPYARNPMRVRFVPRSGLPADAVSFPLRRIAEDDRRRLVEFLAGQGHQIRLGTVGWP